MIDDKLDNVVLLKFAFDELCIDKSKLSDKFIGEFELDVISDISNEWYGGDDPIELGYEEELQDYTEFIRYNFAHPVIKDFFHTLKTVEVELRDEFEESLTKILWDMIHISFYNDLFVELIDEEGCVVNSYEDTTYIRFEFSSLDNPLNFMRGLKNCVEYCSKAINIIKNSQKNMQQLVSVLQQILLMKMIEK